jgi:hypothetical protein
MAEMTLADHAEYWCRKKGKKVPRRGTAEWQEMYETWVNWAFADLRGEKKRRPPKQGRR